MRASTFDEFNGQLVFQPFFCVQGFIYPKIFISLVLIFIKSTSDCQGFGSVKTELPAAVEKRQLGELQKAYYFFHAFNR